MTTLLMLALLGQFSIAGQAPDSVTTKDLDFWVTTTGSDGFDCLQPARACATVQGAYNKVPKNSYHNVVIHLGLGSYNGAVAEGFTTHPAPDLVNKYSIIELRGVMTPFTVTTGTNSGTLTNFAALSGATMAVLTDSTATWTVNNLQGQLVAIVGGTGSPGTPSAPPIYPIVSNTATTITVAASGAIAATGSKYQIQRCGSRINAAPTAATVTGTPSSTGIFQVGLSFNTNAGAFMVVNQVGFDVGTAMPRGINIGNARLRVLASQVSMGTGSSSGISTSSVDNVGPWSIQNTTFVSTVAAPLFSSGNGGNAPATAGGAIANCYFKGGSVGVSLGGAQNTLILSSVFDTNTSAIATNFSSQLNVQNVRITGATNGIIAAFTSVVFPTANIGLLNADISNSTTAISLQGPHAGITMTSVSGGTNTTGINISLGAQARAAATVSLTGTTEVSIDGVTTTLATMRAATPKVVRDANYASILFE